MQLPEVEMPPLRLAFQPAHIRNQYVNSAHHETILHHWDTKKVSLTHSEKRIRARASPRRIKLSICLGVAVITC